MPTEQIETIEQFAWDGYLTPAQAFVVGAVLLVVFALLTSREYVWTHKRIVWLFWPLRAVALIVALWMLMGPTNEILLRRTTPKTVAIFADGSGSMQVVDPPEAMQDLRWELAAEVDDQSHAVAVADQLATATRFAASRLGDASSNLDRGESRQRVLVDVEAARTALSRAEQLLADWSELAPFDTAGGDHTTVRAEQSLRASLESADGELLQVVESKSADAFGLIERAVEELDRAARNANRLSRLAGESVVATGHVVAQAVSTSSAIAATSGARDRRKRVVDALDAAERSWLGDIGNDVRVRRFRFDTTVQAVSGDNWSEALADHNSSGTGDAGSGAEGPVAASAASTDLTAALAKMVELAADEQLEAVILISDGRHNAFATSGGTVPQLPRDQAASMIGLPVHVVPIGSGKTPRDLILHHVDAPTAVDQKDTVVIGAVLSAFRYEGESCTVELLQDDRVIDRQVISIDADRGDYRVTFSTKAPPLGRHEFALRAEVLADETDTGNNSQMAKVDVVEDTLKVLLADGTPRWEFRYLQNLFYRDERVEFDTLLFAPRRQATGRLARSGAFPTTAEAWRPYRVIVLGDVSPGQFTGASQQALIEHVTRQGAAVIIVAGGQHMPHDFVGMPLEQLLPVEPYRHGSVAGGHQLTLTSEGREEAALLLADTVADTARVWLDMSQRLPVHSMSRFSQAKATSHTLIQATPTRSLRQASRGQADDDLAFLCWQRMGRGRVVHLAAPISYQLRYRYGDRYHHRFWGQLIRWATAVDLSGGSRTVQLRTDKFRYQTGDAVQVIARLEDLDGQPVLATTPRVTVTRGEQVAATLDLSEDENIPGRYLGRFDSLPAGELQVQIAGAEVDRLLRAEKVEGPITSELTVDADASREMVDIGSDPALLGQVAELTGGQVIPPTALSEVFQLASLAPEVTEQTRREPLWNRWIYFCIMMVCLSTEWTLRKFRGLA